jgi:hypothetical protein
VNAIDPVARHAGVARVMSRTYAVLAATPVFPLSAAVPALRILPGSNITALPPSCAMANQLPRVVAATPVANAALVKLSAAGTMNTFVNVATHVIIDVNGYFTGTQ